MHLYSSITFVAVVVLMAADGTAATVARPSERRPTIAAYYFGNYHGNDARNQKELGPGWSEWELVKKARQKFPGHLQPRVPLWGYGDESDPEVMTRKIDAAADNGIDVFIFDWYYYDDGPFLEGALESGFLRSMNNRRVQFALMWANHDWFQSDFIVTSHARYPGIVRPETFDKVTDLLIREYFSRENYWRLGGRPYFSFFDVHNLVMSFGGVHKARQALDRFREKAKAAGLGGLHLNVITLEAEAALGKRSSKSTAQLIHDLGFDSVSSYNWLIHVPPPTMQTPYEVVRDGYFRFWEHAQAESSVPYIPNVTVGWDRSPRDTNPEAAAIGSSREDPYRHVVVGNTPQALAESLRRVKAKMAAQHAKTFNAITLCCWNEWTEGSYLEPDTRYGMKYLEAVRDEGARTSGAQTATKRRGDTTTPRLH